MGYVFALGVAMLLALPAPASQASPPDACQPVVKAHTPVSRGLPTLFYDQARSSIAAIHPRHRLLADRREGAIGRVAYSLVVFQPTATEPVMLQALAVEFATNRAWDVNSTCSIDAWPGGLIVMMETLSALPEPRK